MMVTPFHTVLCRIWSSGYASASKQVNMLLHCLGEEAESMLKSTNITEEETKNYETVLEKFNSLFQ